MKNKHKHRYQGYVYLHSNLDKETAQRLLDSQLTTDYFKSFKGGDDSYGGIYLQDMNELRDSHFYKKVGKKFHPLRSEYDTFGLSEGMYIITVKPGSTSWVRMIDKPATAEVEAALEEFSNQLCKLIVEAQSRRPQNEKMMTVKQKKCWEKWNKEVGNDFFHTLKIETVQDTVDKAKAFLREKIKEKYGNGI